LSLWSESFWQGGERDAVASKWERSLELTVDLDTPDGDTVPERHDEVRQAEEYDSFGVRRNRSGREGIYEGQKVIGINDYRKGESQVKS
jgi:hypothetical protein